MRVNGTLIKEIEHGSDGVFVLAKWAVPYRALQTREVVELVEFDEPILQSLTLQCGGLDRDLALPVGFALTKWVEAFHTATAGDVHDMQDEAASECRDNYYYNREEWQERQREEAAA